MFSQERCQQCRATLRRFARAGVEVEVVSALEHIDFLRGLGLRVAPGVVVFDGDRVVDCWGGFVPAKVDAWAVDARAAGAACGFEAAS